MEVIMKRELFQNTEICNVTNAFLTVPNKTGYYGATYWQNLDVTAWYYLGRKKEESERFARLMRVGKPRFYCV